MTILEREAEIKDYFKDMGVDFTHDFSLTVFSAENGLTVHDAHILLCNLEDRAVMEDIANEEYQSFDVTDRSQFNDSYLDIMEDLFGEIPDEDDEDTVTFKLPKFEECTTGLLVEDMPYGPSPDDFSDPTIIDDIYKQMESNDWAWCMVEHKVSWKGISESEVIGNCSYKDENDYVENSGYYHDKMRAAYERLIARLKGLATK